MDCPKDKQMNDKEFSEYVMSECERQWIDNQEEEYGSWDKQSEDVRTEYYYNMYRHLKP